MLGHDANALAGLPDTPGMRPIALKQVFDKPASALIL